MISLNFTGGCGFLHIFNYTSLHFLSSSFSVNHSCIFLVSYSLHIFNQILLYVFSQLLLHFLVKYMYSCILSFLSNPLSFQSIIPVYSWTSTSGETTATTSPRSTFPAPWWWFSPGSTSGWQWTLSPRGYPSVSSLSWPPQPRVLRSSPTYRKCPI